MLDRRRHLGNRGLSVIELLMVIVIVGMVALFVFPSVVKTFDRVQVRGARTALVNSYHSARTAARVSNLTTTLNLTSHRIWVERVKLTGGVDTIGGVTNLSSQYGVLVSGPPTITIDPRGMLASRLDAGLTFVFSRGGWSDSVVFSNYGRVSR